MVAVYALFPQQSLSLPLSNLSGLQPRPPPTQFSLHSPQLFSSVSALTSLAFAANSFLSASLRKSISPQYFYVMINSVQPCISWSNWGQWSLCLAPCGFDRVTRSRSCINGEVGDFGCLGEPQESRVCYTQVKTV